MRSDILKFFKKAFLLTFLLILTDQVIGYGLQKLYFRLDRGQFAQTTYSVNEADEDIIIFGSSRAARHYSPAIISQGIGGLSCYNVGRDGQFIPYYSALEEVIIKRHKPKMIILDMNIWELAPNNEKYEKLSALLPFISRHPELKAYTNEISKWESLKMFSRTYAYNSTLFISLHDYLFKNRIPKDSMGYLPLTRRMSEQEFENYKAKKNLYDNKRSGLTIPVDQKSVAYYRKFLNKTRELGIKTYVIISPTILKEPMTKEKKLVGNIAQSYPNVTFLDFSDDSRYNYQYNKFADAFHLNKLGAEQFSRDLLAYL